MGNEYNTYSGDPDLQGRTDSTETNTDVVQVKRKRRDSSMQYR